MSATYIVGTGLYAAAVAGVAWLAGRLMHTGAHRDYPVFTAFAAFTTAEHFVMFPLYFARHFAEYARVWHVARPIGVALTLAVCVECVRHAWRLSPRIERALQLAAVVPAALLIGNFRVDVDWTLRCAVGLACLLCAPRAARMPVAAFGILTGTFASEILPAIVERQSLLDARPWLQYTTTASFLLALAVWISYLHGDAQANRAATVR